VVGTETGPELGAKEKGLAAVGGIEPEDDPKG